MSTAVQNISPTNPIPRAIASCVVGLATWWFLLKRASLHALFLISYGPLLFLIAPPGYRPISINEQTHQWVFNVALNVDAPEPKTGKLERIGSAEFAEDEDSVAHFASGWIVFLALCFAVGGFRRHRLSATAKGFGAQTMTTVVGLAAYAYVNAYASVVTAETNPLLLWSLRLVFYIESIVAPFAGPFIIAVVTQPSWREYLLPQAQA